MLFDLRGKRKRAVQVTYAALAVIFLVGFVGFSIGSGNAPGGLLDAIGLGGNSNSSGSLSTQFDPQISAANAQLAKHPNDTKTLLQLAKYEYFKGKQGVTQDPTTGQVAVSQDAHTELGHSADAWEKYLKVNKGAPNPSVAGYMVQVYYLLNDANGAAQAQQIVAQHTPSSGSYGQLAFYRYASFNIPAGDAAAKRAESLATKAQRKQISGQLTSIRKQAVKLKKQQAKAQKAAKKAGTNTNPAQNPLANPFGGAGLGP